MRSHIHRPSGLMLPLLAGLALRLVAASSIHAPWGDNGAAVLDVAKNLTTGRGFTTQRVWTFYGTPKQFGQPEGNRQPLLPVLEAGVRRLGGPGFRAAQAIPLAFGLAVIMISHSLGTMVGGPLAGSLAAWFSALDPPQVYFSAQVEDQILFTAFFLCLLLWSIRSRDAARVSPWVPGVLLAALYLTRANGLLVVMAYVGVSLWRRRVGHAVSVLLVWGALSVPWFIRNIHAFGNPLHTENAYFLWSDDFWSVFSVRAEAPSLGDYLARHSLVEIAVRWVKGAYLIVEGFLMGNVFRGEPFARGSLILPLAAAGFGLRRCRWPWAVVGVAFGLHFVTVAWHAHGTYRYFLPFYAVVYVGAGAGLALVWNRWMSPRSRHERVVAWGVGVLVFAFPLVRPMINTLRAEDREVHREALEVVEWIEGSTPNDAVIMGFPVVEKYVYRYDRPTVMTPYGPIGDVWRVVCDYRVDYLVVCPEQLRWLPALREHWIADGSAVFERSVPVFLEPVLATSQGRFRVYRINREVLCT